MSTVFVTAGTGQLGRLVVEALLPDVEAHALRVVVGARDTGKVPQEWVAKGVKAKKADYEDGVEAWAEALQGVDRVLLISSNTGINESRAQQHANVIDGGKKAGVQFIAYTGIINGDTTTLNLAQDHRKTEAYLKASGVPYAFLRNGWYLENWFGAIPGWKATGKIFAAAGEARFSAALRREYAEAAAAVLRPAFADKNVVLELGGDEAFTLHDVAEVASQALGKKVTYQSLPGEAYKEALTSHGVPEGLAEHLVDADEKAGAEGSLFNDSRTLSKLIGHPTASYKAVFANALRATPLEQ